MQRWSPGGSGHLCLRGQGRGPGLVCAGPDSYRGGDSVDPQGQLEYPTQTASSPSIALLTVTLVSDDRAKVRSPCAQTDVPSNFGTTVLERGGPLRHPRGLRSRRV